MMRIERFSFSKNLYGMSQASVHADNVIRLACRAGGTSIAFGYEILKNELDVVSQWPFSDSFMSEFGTQMERAFNENAPLIA